MISKVELIAFEKDIAAEYDAGHIRAPIHLDGGNEEQLIEIFEEIGPNDWICGSWRQHYHCLLKGVPPELLKAEIMAGKSITLCFPQYRVISSAIVGGILPIALGLAWSIKRNGGNEKVWTFVGDMTAKTGIFSECLQYAEGHKLPISFIIEDNGKSVCTDTNSVWGKLEQEYTTTVTYFRYSHPWPHSGAGKRVNF
jgi:TPP-dependent pyruvate/acetoin dehydrogenase alpha subunit